MRTSYDVMMTVFASVPVNGTAKSVVSQSGASEQEFELSNDELVEAVNRLEAKRQEYKDALGITKRSHHVNFMYRYNRGGRNTKRVKSGLHAAAADEYVRLGKALEELHKELALRRKARRFVAEATSDA